MEIEKLLSIMNIHSIDCSQQRTRSKPSLSSSDIVTALSYSSLSQAAYNLVLAKYCNDQAAESQLIAHLEEKIQRSIIKHKWRDTHGRALGLAHIVMIEGVYGTACKGCIGAGFIYNKNPNPLMSLEKTRCRKCGGTGNSKLSNSQKANLIHISKSNWLRTWETRCNKFLQYINNLDQEAHRHLIQQFFKSQSSPIEN